MVSRSMRWLGLLPALLMPALGLWPEAAFSERNPHGAAVAPAAAQEDPNQARVIVKFRPASALALGAGAGATGRAQHAGRLGSRLALPLIDGRPLGPHTQALRGRGLSSRQLAARLAAQPDVEWAVVDERRYIAAVPNDPYYAAGQTGITPSVGQWYLHKPDSTLVAAINAESAWDLSTGSAAVTVAALDTGVRFDHPDLQGKLWPGYDFVSRDTSSRDGDGSDPDPSDPGDWSLASDTCGARNSSWHGTQVAGLIGANTGNGIGMASVGQKVMVLPVRVLGKCGGFDSDIQAAMLWAAGLSSDPVANPHPARVINLSLGSPTGCGSYQPVINQLVAAGVVVVVAAGNSTGEAVNAPANCSDVIAVAGLRHAGTKVGYSSLGPEVAVAAPAGNCVNETGACLYPLLTTDNSGSTSPGANIYSDSFKASLGTSFASPLVAGTVGLMLSVDPSLTPARVKTILQATARAFPGIGAQTEDAVACQAPNGTQQVECYCTTSTCGAGMLDAGAAVAKAAGAASPPLALITASASAQSAGRSVDLAAVSSSRSVVAYRWSLLSGSSFTAISGAADAPAIRLTSSAAGDAVVRVVVTDAAGATASEVRTINFFAHPTVVIGAGPADPTAGDRLVFTGASSFASIGRSIASYQWAVTSADAQVTFVSSSNASTVTLQANAAGTVQLSLTVIDNTGEGRTASKSFTVAAAPMAVISASSVMPAAGGSVALDSAGSTVAAGRTLTGYRWAIASGTALASFAGSTTGSTATLATSGVGVVVVALTVSDNTGASHTSSVTINVAAPATSSGGGALGGGWLWGLAAAVLALRRLRRP